MGNLDTPMSQAQKVVELASRQNLRCFNESFPQEKLNLLFKLPPTQPWQKNAHL